MSKLVDAGELCVCVIVCASKVSHLRRKLLLFFCNALLARPLTDLLLLLLLLLKAMSVTRWLFVCLLQCWFVREISLSLSLSVASSCCRFDGAWKLCAESAAALSAHQQPPTLIWMCTILRAVLWAGCLICMSAGEKTTTTTMTMISSSQPSRSIRSDLAR